MSWKYRRPQFDDYDSEEEYEEAVAAYEDAEDMYIEECLERARGIE